MTTMNQSGFMNLNMPLVEPLDSEIDLSNHLVDTINDSDLFKYFLNEDLSSFENNSDYMIPTSSPSSSYSLEASSSDSPQPSPPQLSPEVVPVIDSVLPSPASSHPITITSTPNIVSSAPVPIRVKQELVGRAPTLPTSVAVNMTDAAQKAKINRKRERKEDLESPQQLSRDELMKLSSKGVDSFAQTITTGKQGPEDEKQLKRQKRLIKNRESAQLSRLRKKIYIEELEKKVSHLTAETENLSKQVAGLSNDKRKLHEEVLYLQSIIKQSPELSEIANRRVVIPAKNMKAAGVCLLIVLFSFGLIFNANQNSNLPFGSRNREEIPEVLPKPKSLYTGRILKSIPEEAAVIPLTPEVKEPRVITVLDEEPMQSAIVPSKEVKKHPREDIEKASKEKRKKMKISDEDLKEDSAKGLVPIDSAQVARSAKQNAEIVPRRDPNASYIYCPDALHVVPATSTSGTEIVALLIPASVLNGTIFANQPGFDTSLLEISCSVLNLHMWPMNNHTNTNAATTN